MGGFGSQQGAYDQAGGLGDYADQQGAFGGQDLYGQPGQDGGPDPWATPMSGAGGLDQSLMGQPGDVNTFGDDAYGQPSNFAHDDGGHPPDNFGSGRDVYGDQGGLGDVTDPYSGALGRAGDALDGQFNEGADRFGDLADDAALAGGAAALGAAGGAFAMNRHDDEEYDRGGSYGQGYDSHGIGAADAGAGGLSGLDDRMGGLQMRDEREHYPGDDGIGSYGQERALGMADNLVRDAGLDHRDGAYRDQLGGYDYDDGLLRGEQAGAMIGEQMGGRGYEQGLLRGEREGALLGAGGLSGQYGGLDRSLGAGYIDREVGIGGVGLGGEYGRGHGHGVGGLGDGHGYDRGIGGSYGQALGFSGGYDRGLGGFDSYGGIGAYGHGSPYSHVGIDGGGYLPGARMHEQSLYYNPAVSTRYGFGSGFGHQHRPGAYGSNSYQDLLYYENELSMASIDEAERARRWQERTTFEALEDAQRAQRWREMSMMDRSRLGLHAGFWGASLGGADSYSRSLQYGLGGGSFSPAYSFSPGLQSAYGSYMSPTYANTSRSMFDDQYLVANDLAAYTRALQLDATLQEQERLRRWRERQAFEALEATEQRRRWAQMAEAQRLALGLGSQGFASTRFGGAQPYASLYSPQSLRPMRYPLSDALRQQYQPYLNAGANAYDPRWAQQRDWQQRAAFMDLTRFENSLRAGRLAERDRQMRWQRRLAFQQQSEAQRRQAWWRMKEAERAALGLGSRDSFYGRRYASLGAGYGRVLPMSQSSLRRPLPSRLRQAYQPYAGRGFQPTRTDGTAFPSRGPLGASLGTQAARQAAQATQIKMQLARQRLAQANASVDQLRRAEDQQRKLVSDLERRKQVAEGRPIASRTWHARGT